MIVIVVIDKPVTSPLGKHGPSYTISSQSEESNLKNDQTSFLALFYIIYAHYA